MRYVIHASVPVAIHVDDREDNPVQRVFIRDSVLDLPGLRRKVETDGDLTRLVTGYGDDSPVQALEASRIILLAEEAEYWPGWEWE